MRGPMNFPFRKRGLSLMSTTSKQAIAELETQGYRMLVKARKEPWGQTVSRLLGPEGLLLGITFTPWMRGAK